MTVEVQRIVMLAFMSRTMDRCRPPSYSDSPNIDFGTVHGRPLRTALWGLLLVGLPNLALAGPEGADDPLVTDADMDEGPAAEGKETSESAETGAKRLLVLPYQAIYRSADPEKTRLTTDLVVRELSKSSGVEVVRGGVAKDKDAKPLNESIDELLKTVETHRANKDIGALVQALNQALKAMDEAPSALESSDQYILTQHRLAQALLWAGEDEKAKKQLDVAARMAPNFDLSTKTFSRFYRAMFETAAKKVLKDRPAEILVRSALPGATIVLDGRETEVAPVRLQRAIPGQHLIQAKVKGVPTAAAVVTLKPGKNKEFTVSFGDTWGGVAVGAVADAIAENRLSAKAVQKAVEAGKEAEADFVVAGGMAHDKVAAKFNVHTFVVNVTSGGVMRLEMTNFDLDMLTAESDVFRIVRGVEGSVKNFGDAKKAVASIEVKVSPVNTITAVDAKPSLNAKSRSKKPIQRDRKREVIRVLQGSGKIRIKDEER